MFVKIHYNQGRAILAICDDDLIGKKIEDGKLQLDLTSDFYMGKKTKHDEIKKIIEKAYYVNFVGKESVGFGVKLGILEKNKIHFIKKIPHANVILF